MYSKLKSPRIPKITACVCRCCECQNGYLFHLKILIVLSAGRPIPTSKHITSLSNLQETLSWFVSFVFGTFVIMSISIWLRILLGLPAPMVLVVWVLFLEFAIVTWRGIRVPGSHRWIKTGLELGINTILQMIFLDLLAETCFWFVFGDTFIYRCFFTMTYKIFLWSKYHINSIDVVLARLCQPQDHPQ